jgi:hypothetical protein
MSQPPARTWWSRNWKWVIPVGCLTPAVLCCGGGGLILTSVLGALKSSEVYTDALARAKANEEVRTLLGEPIEAGFWVSGSVEVGGTSGKADLSIPVSGPKGSATLHVVATKAGGKWVYSTLEVVPQGSGATIDLRPPPEP